MAFESWYRLDSSLLTVNQTFASRPDNPISSKAPQMNTTVSASLTGLVSVVMLSAVFWAVSGSVDIGLCGLRIGRLLASFGGSTDARLACVRFGGPCPFGLHQGVLGGSSRLCSGNTGCRGCSKVEGWWL
ncbi:hypothetical protein CONLIGDRAFT_649038 [Coniochaeta ligniaria NRRL 30616]|uniref:Uncharacterized protein n=1 Tax=Coniochaeta ligniaria NRRL 30616 TaxID=1408157 RepID=A0A1J7IA03_9PEZI|nr:hypothetical protein CONLIGDRAFT_649038 [Coniochaeta ligniaria NRRL 30616]